MRFASLGSGSRGNSLLVDAGDTKLLVDCGFSLRATLHRLARLGVGAEEITGILVTHEHGDHVAGVARFAARYAIPVYLTHGTRAACAPDPDTAFPACVLIDSHIGFRVGSLEVMPYPVPHDAREPVQYVFSDGMRRLGVLTDCGTITSHVAEILHGCQGLVLECNHAPELLAASGYPKTLKRRIAGNFGHLANEQSADLLKKIDTRRLQHVVAAHLSEENNRADLVRRVLAGALGCEEHWIGVASQDHGFCWREIT